MKQIAMMFLILILAAVARGGEIVIDSSKIGDVKAATIVAGKNESNGKIDKPSIVFTNLKPKIPHDIRIDLADGKILQGVNLNWYDVDEPAKDDAGEMTDDDRGQISEIIAVPSFYDRSEIVLMRGDHDRAAVLVQLVREKDFHDGNGNVIWRMELWYFKNQHGGWEKIAQQNKVLHRERFKTPDDFKAATGKIVWSEKLGGIVLRSDDEKKTLQVDGK